MLTRLGRLIVRFPWLVAAAWVLLAGSGYLLAFGALGTESLFDRLETGKPSASGSQSDRADELLAERFAADEEITLMISGIDPTDPAVMEVMAQTTARLAAVDGAADPISPYVFPGGPADPDAQPWLSRTGDGFLVSVPLDPAAANTSRAETAAQVTSILNSVAADLAQATAVESGKVSGTVSSTDQVVEAITSQVREDLETGETVSLPIALLVMVLVFGGFLAAGMPIAGGLASIGGGLGALLGITHLMEVDASVVNVVTLLTLGLSIDYGLLIVSRFREELHRENPDDADVPRPASDAIIETLRTAGRTVTFSALTVAISIAGLMVFSPEILRSVGAGSLVAVLIAVGTAITLVPALLAVTGRRLARPSAIARVPGLRRILTQTADVQSDDGPLSRLALRVQRRPWWVAGGTLLVLGLLAAPVLHLHVRNSGIELLPVSAPQRQFVDDLTTNYPAATRPDMAIVAQTDEPGATAWATQLAQLPGVTGIDPAIVAGPYVSLGVRLNTADPGGDEATEVVRAIRALDPGFDYWVTGQAATQLDFLDALAARAWWAISIVVAATLVLLFLMTGSIVIPIKALLTNALSLCASLGVLVWAFQDGHLEVPLAFTSPGGIETYVVAMVLAFAFGLAMDYEVFLLARVKELYDAGYSNDDAVRIGLQRSGRIITSAAAIIVVVFAGFVAGELLVIKEIGFALAVAVAIDASLVRLLLVPATMTLLGRHNWWAPGPLRRLHERFDMSH